MILTACVTSRLVMIKNDVCLSVNRFSLFLSLARSATVAQCGTGSTQRAGKRPDMSEKLLTGTYCMR